MSEGWIKLYRKIMESSFYRDSELVHLWVHLMLNAKKFPVKWDWGGQEITLNPGQFITGRKKIAEQTGINENKVQRGLKKFEKCHMIEQQTNNRSRLITIVSWDMHQESERQMNNQRTTSEQQVNTNKESKKEESKNKTYSEDSIEFRIANFLYQNILKNKSDFKKPNLQKWADDSRLMLERDKRNIETVKKLIVWVQKDEFEMKNVQSVAKLRNRFDNLEMKMNSGNQKQKTETVSHPSHREL